MKERGAQNPNDERYIVDPSFGIGLGSLAVSILVLVVAVVASYTRLKQKLDDHCQQDVEQWKEIKEGLKQVTDNSNRISTIEGRLSPHPWTAPGHSSSGDGDG